MLCISIRALAIHSVFHWREQYGSDKLLSFSEESNFNHGFFITVICMEKRFLEVAEKMFIAT